MFFRYKQAFSFQFLQKERRNEMPQLDDIGSEPIRILIKLHFTGREEPVSFVVLWHDDHDDSVLPPDPSMVSAYSRREGGLWAEPNKRVAWDDSRVECMEVSLCNSCR